MTKLEEKINEYRVIYTEKNKTADELREWLKKEVEGATRSEPKANFNPKFAQFSLSWEERQAVVSVAYNTIDKKWLGIVGKDGAYLLQEKFGDDEIEKMKDLIIEKLALVLM